MNFVVKNKKQKTNQPIICTLGDNTTLRLNIGAEITLTDKQITPHIKNLASKGYITIEEEKSVTAVTKKKEKEEKQDGNI